MKKDDFQEDTRYVVSLKDNAGKVRPAKFYLLKCHKDNMIVRFTDGDGGIRKIAYENVVKIVAKHPVPEQNRYHMPAALLDEKHWKEREELIHYSSMSHAGK
ncbi:MAG: hypothetical protein OEZ43_08790 [Gammaproteobacteria bacterium]|nr:hypothetical protein [Gammaproteobacteria bacterium]